MNEIMRELLETGKAMEKLIDRAEFRVGDAQKFLRRWDNICRSLEDMEKSRDMWKALAKELKKDLKKLKKK